MKLVREGSRPISGDSGLDLIRKLAEENSFAPCQARGTVSVLDIGNHGQDRENFI